MPKQIIKGILLCMNKRVSVLLFMLLWLTVSCDLVNSFTQTDAAGNTPEAVLGGTAVSTNIPPLESTPDIAIPTTAVSQTQPTLRVWLSPEIALSTEEGAAILNAQLAAFRSSHPTVQLTVEQKAVSGQSGILNYLRTGRIVAPTILPDLIAIPIDQLSPALTENLIYPMDGLIETSLLEDLYPAALNLVLKENRLSGYPFILTGLPQLAYNSETVTTTIPTRWESLATLPNKFVFPANGPIAGILGLEFYLAAGGTLTNDAGQVALQVEPLATALQQLFTAKSSGFILDQSGNYSTQQESWQLFLAGTADFTLTSSEQYLRQRDENGKYLVTAVPGITQPLDPLLSGWAWAITTDSPARRDLAGELLNILIASDQLGEWSYASNYLPAQQAALAFWPQEDAYVAFATEQLSRAKAMPISSTSSIMTILNNAVFDVVTLAKTPQAAAEEAAAAIATITMTPLHFDQHADHIQAIISAALKTADPATAVYTHLQKDGHRLTIGPHDFDLGNGRLFIIAIGKAALPMGQAALEIVGETAVSGGIITKYLPENSISPLPAYEGNHPVPGERKRGSDNGRLSQPHLI